MALSMDVFQKFFHQSAAMNSRNARHGDISPAPAWRRCGEDRNHPKSEWHSKACTVHGWIFSKKSEMPVASSLPEALQKFRSFNLSWCCLHMKNVSLSDKEHWYTPVCPECRVVPLKGEALVMVGSDAADALWYDFLCIFTGVVSPTMLKVPSIDAVFE